MSQGSAIPNARFSSVTNLTVNPPTWSSHPKIDKSCLTNCTLNALSTSTRIDHSCLKNTTISSSSGAKTGKSNIDRSNLEGADVTDSHIDRSTIKNGILHFAHLDRSTVGPGCFIDSSRLDRSTVSNSKITGHSGAERSDVKESEVSGKSYVARSKITASHVMSSTRAERSVVKYSNIEKSWMERSSVVECEVTNCRFERTEFKGMRLANGKWERGNLVGRMGDGEVICEKIDVAEDRERREQQEMERLQQPLQPTAAAAPRNGFLPDQKTSQPDAPNSLRINIEHSADISKEPDSKREHLVTSPISDAGTASSGVGWSTGLPDAETELELEMYDGPRRETPPPPYED